MKLLKSATLLLVVILLFSFSVFNMHPVRVSFYAWESPELPLFLMLIFSFALGVAVAALWGTLRAVGRDRAPKRDASPKEKKGEEKKDKERDKKTALKGEAPERGEEANR